jgi:hypothetical protein
MIYFRIPGVSLFVRLSRVIKWQLFVHWDDIFPFLKLLLKQKFIFHSDTLHYTVLLLQIFLVDILLLNITYLYYSHWFSLKYISLCFTFPPAVDSRYRWLSLTRFQTWNCVSPDLQFLRYIKNEVKHKLIVTCLVGCDLISYHIISYHIISYHISLFFLILWILTGLKTPYEYENSQYYSIVVCKKCTAVLDVQGYQWRTQEFCVWGWQRAERSGIWGR